MLLEYSAAVSVSWQRPDSLQPPDEFREIFAGECRWSLERLPALLDEYKSWVENCFPDPTDKYDAVWHGKFPFLEVDNGDMVAIDLVASGQPVVYLGHDDGGGHGYRLGHSFIEYIDALFQLGCTGAEDWQWLAFVDGPTSGLLTETPQAQRWRDWLGVSCGRHCKLESLAIIIGTIPTDSMLEGLSH